MKLSRPVQLATAWQVRRRRRRSRSRATSWARPVRAGAAALFLDEPYEPLRRHGVEREGVLVGVGTPGALLQKISDLTAALHSLLYTRTDSTAQLQDGAGVADRLRGTRCVRNTKGW